MGGHAVLQLPREYMQLSIYTNTVKPITYQWSPRYLLDQVGSGSDAIGQSLTHEVFGFQQSQCTIRQNTQES